MKKLMKKKRKKLFCFCFSLFFFFLFLLSFFLFLSSLPFLSSSFLSFLSHVSSSLSTKDPLPAAISSPPCHRAPPCARRSITWPPTSPAVDAAFSSPLFSLTRRQHQPHDHHHLARHSPTDAATIPTSSLGDQ